MSPTTYTVRPSTTYKSAIALARILAVAILCAGCFGSSEPSPEPEAKELRADSDPLATEVPEAELTHLSKRLYQVGMYTVARDSLASLKDRYPMGAHATFAELKHADSFFFNHENDLAAKLYEDFLKNHPGSPEAPYAKLQAARSHVASARTSGRDRNPWERALTIYDEIVAKYAGTAYAEIARQERIAVILELSAYDREIIEFYRNTGNTAAVDERERRFSERWGARLSEVDQAQSSQVPTALALLRDLPPVAAPRPALQEPPSPTLQAADSTTTATIGQPDATPSHSNGGSATMPLDEGRIAVQSVVCSSQGVPFATIEVMRIPEQLLSYETTPGTIEPESGVVTIAGVMLASRQTSFYCFDSNDLVITDAGDLRLTSEVPVSITVLQSPPRILLSPVG